MAIEAALVKPIVDVVLSGLKKIKGAKLKKDAAAELSEVIRNLIQLNPDINGAEAKIQTAKVAGVISKDLVLAEQMLNSVKPHLVAKKTAAGKKPAAKKTSPKKPATKKAAVKKPVAKKAAVKKPAAKKAP